MKFIDSLILFASLAFVVMWVDQFVYKSVSMKDSYFFLMFGMSGFLFYIYRRGVRKIEDHQNANKPKEMPKKKKK